MSMRQLLSKPTWSARSLLSGGANHAEHDVASRKAGIADSGVSSEPSDPSKILAVNSSLDTPANDKNSEGIITKDQLHRLYRLSALRDPKDTGLVSSALNTIETQLAFVRHIQSVDTANVEPLRAIRDETEAALRARTIGTGKLMSVLEQEHAFGFRNRPKRGQPSRQAVDDQKQWNPLATASRKEGKYFVVSVQEETTGRS